MQLKSVTPGSRCSRTTVAAGHTGTALAVGSTKSGDCASVCYVSSGLALATFPSSVHSRFIVGAAPGPITIIKCSVSGGTLVTVHDQNSEFEVLIWKARGGGPSTRFTTVQRPIDIDFAGSGGRLEFSHAIREAAQVVCFSTHSTFVTGGIHHLAMWTIGGAEGGKKVHKLPFKLGAHAAHSSFVDIMACRTRCPGTPAKMLALASDGKVLEFEHGRAAPDRIVQARVPQATAFSMLGSNLVVITGGGGMVKVMETERWTTVVLLPAPPSFPKPAMRHGHASPRNRNDMSVAATAVVADGHDSVVVQYADSTLCCWRLQDPVKATVKWEYVGHAGAIVDLCAPAVPYGEKTPDRVYATVCSDGYARVWRTSSCNEGVAQMQMSVRLERTSPQPALETSQMLPAPGYAVAAISNSGEMLAIGEPAGCISVYILPSPTRYRLDIAHDGKVTCLSWGTAHNGQYLASGGHDGRVHLHRIHSARISPLKTIEARSAVRCMAMLDANSSQTLTLAIGEQNGTVTTWRLSEEDLITSHELRLQDVVECLEPVINCVQALACHNRFVVMSNDLLVLVLEPECGQILQLLKLKNSSIPTCIGSAGSVIACGHQNGSVSLVDAVTGEDLATVKSHSESVSGCWLDANRLELMTTSYDGCTHIWDIGTMAQRLQQSAEAPKGVNSLQPKGASVQPNRRPESLPLQDLQNVIAGHHQDEVELAPLPSHLFSPSQSLKPSGACNTNVLAASVPLLRDHMHVHQSSIDCVSAESVENEEHASLPIRGSRAQQDQASGRRLRGSSLSAFRHSIAGDPSAELRREALQRQRDHKLWESNYMPLWERLRSELETHPARRSSMHRKSMTHIEMKAVLPDRLHLNLASVLSPIPQSVSESMSTARTSKCLRTSSLSFRRSFSAPLESPQPARHSAECANPVSPLACTASGVDESFSSLTLPSPTTLVCGRLQIEMNYASAVSQWLAASCIACNHTRDKQGHLGQQMQARDLLKIEGHMQPPEQESSVVTPARTPHAQVHSPQDEAVRSDVKRGFAWQDNRVFKDAQRSHTGSTSLADQPHQHRDSGTQSIHGISLSPDVQSECRPAPAPTLAKAIQDHGAAVANNRLASKIARFSVSKSLSSSGQSEMAEAGDFRGIEQEQDGRPLSCGVEGFADPHVTRSSSPSVHVSPNRGQRDTSEKSASAILQGAKDPVTSTQSLTSSARRSLQQISAFPETPEHSSSPITVGSSCRRIPRPPSHSRAGRASCDSLDTPLSSLASMPSHHAQATSQCMLQRFMNGSVPLQFSPMKQAATHKLGSIPKPRGSDDRVTPDFGQIGVAGCKSGTSPGQVTGFGARRQRDASSNVQYCAPACSDTAPQQRPGHENMLTAAPQDFDQSCGHVSGDRIDSRSNIDVSSAPACRFSNDGGLSAALDAAFSSALRDGVQQVIQEGVTKGWNLGSQEFRISLAAQFSKESRRLATISDDLCRSGVPWSAHSNVEDSDSVSIMFDQLSVLQSRVPNFGLK